MPFEAQRSTKGSDEACCLQNRTASPPPVTYQVINHNRYAIGNTVTPSRKEHLTAPITFSPSNDPQPSSPALAPALGLAVKAVRCSLLGRSLVFRCWFCCRSLIKKRWIWRSILSFFTPKWPAFCCELSRNLAKYCHRLCLLQPGFLKGRQCHFDWTIPACTMFSGMHSKH